MCWAGTAYVARGTAMVRERPDMQLLCMVAVSVPMLLLLSPAFGPLVRDLVPLHLWLLLLPGLAMQCAALCRCFIIIIICCSFIISSNIIINRLKKNKQLLYLAIPPRELGKYLRCSVSSRSIHHSEPSEPAPPRALTSAR